MSRFRSLGEWLRGLVGGARAEAELKEEFDFHLDQEIAANVRSGMTPEEARRQALLAFGGTDWYGERVRDERSGRPLEDLIRDLRMGFRNLRKRPVFALVGVLTLALGVGMSTTMFTLVDAIILHPLPGSNTDGMVYLRQESEDGRMWISPTSQLIEILRDHSSSFSRIEAYSRNPYNVTIGGEPFRLYGAASSEGFFDFLGVRPAQGRGFLPGDGPGGTGPVVVLSHRLWVERFGEDPSVVGRTMVIEGLTFEVIGVLPQSFRVHTPVEIGFWMLDESVPGITPEELSPEAAIARLTEGVSVEAARDELNAILVNNPLDRLADFEWVGLVLTPGDLIDSDLKKALFILQAGALLVLLIGCGNLANLLLAQGEARGPEMAVRASLGARRGRLIRQLLAESLVLGALGGFLGLFLTLWALDSLPLFMPTGYSGFSLDRNAFLFAMALSIGAVLLSGILPALKASKKDLNSVIKGGTTLPQGFLRRGGVRRLLVTSEVAMAFVLLVSAGLLLKSFAGLRGMDTGFDPDGLLTMRLELPEEQYGNHETQVAFVSQLGDRISRGFPPTLGTATLASGFVDNLEAAIGALVPEGTSPDGAENRVFFTRGVEPDFFEALGLPILQGQAFSQGDGLGDEPLVIINERIARQYFPGVDPVGRRFQLREETYRVEGVSGNLDLPDLVKNDIGDLQLFFPLRQDEGSGITVIMRVSGSRSDAVDAMRRLIHDVDPALPILNIAMVNDLLSESLNQERSNALLMALFAFTALLLGAIGIYGVVAYSVSRQIREIGIRLALGASKQRVVTKVVLGSMKTVGVGLVLGVAGAVALGGTLSGLLHEVPSRDPWVFLIVLIGIAGASLLSTWIPARRAAGPSPIRSLNSE